MSTMPTLRPSFCNYYMYMYIKHCVVCGIKRQEEKKWSYMYMYISDQASRSPHVVQMVKAISLEQRVLLCLIPAWGTMFELCCLWDLSTSVSCTCTFVDEHAARHVYGWLVNYHGLFPPHTTDLLKCIPAQKVSVFSVRCGRTQSAPKTVSVLHLHVHAALCVFMGGCHCLIGRNRTQSWNYSTWPVHSYITTIHTPWIYMHIYTCMHIHVHTEPLSTTH